MLILSRKRNESIVIGDGIIIRILRINKDTVKIGIEAPRETRVHREEVLTQPPKNNRPDPAASAPPSTPAPEGKVVLPLDDPSPG